MRMGGADQGAEMTDLLITFGGDRADVGEAITISRFLDGWRLPEGVWAVHAAERPLANCCVMSETQMPVEWFKHIHGEEHKEAK